MSKREECTAFVHLIRNREQQYDKDSNPIMVDIQGEVLYWCMQTVDGAVSPYAIVKDKETGQVYVTYPTNIIFTV